MTTFLLLTVTGLGLAALYFLIASGLSLIYGLMDVLNFSHGAFLTLGSYASWLVVRGNGAEHASAGRFLLGLLVGTAVGAAVAVLIETTLIRRLYGNHVAQVLVTVGLLLAITALVRAIFGSDPVQVAVPGWMTQVTKVMGAPVPNSRFVVIAVAVVVYLGLILFLGRTRYGLVIRAGVENRAMVTALGIDVQRSFTLVFAIGGGIAALGGALLGAFFGSIAPEQGTGLLIIAFIVVIIGGLGSIRGSALAAIVVGLLQQYANFYALVGAGDLIVVLLLAAVLLVRPQGLLGKVATA